MEITAMDAEKLAQAFLAAAKKLEANKDEINELNVFPVPDGDTGTNMTMTIMSAAKEVDALEEKDMRSVCKAISSGSLRGARGNSGVILSQLFRGFTKVIKTESSLDVHNLCEGMQRAVETAYKAVMQPKEGTILTVARAGADKAIEMAEETEDILEFAEGIVKEMDEALQRTPEQLPVLKEAGVVDSGGQGLLMVLSGAFDMLSGKEMDLSIAKEEEKKEAKEPAFSYQMDFQMAPLSKNTHAERKDLRNYMRSLGEKAYLEREGEVYIGRVVTNDPGRIITKALRNGILKEISIVHIDGSEEARAKSKAKPKPVKKKEKKQTPPKAMGVVTVSIGKGINHIFRDLGADHIIEGGQTMNPSTDDIISAIDDINAKTVFVLPNNKNIILSAKQAKEMIKDKEVIVLPTRTLPQGITALINFIPEQSVKENQERMEEEIANVKSGEITHAVRNTTIDGKKIKKGDFMGIGDEGIVSVDADIDEAFMGLIDAMIDEESTLVSIYMGKGTKKRETKKLAKAVEDKYPDVEVEIQEGGQPVYYYVVSVE